jgi:hypothetical protein
MKKLLLSFIILSLAFSLESYGKQVAPRPGHAPQAETATGKPVPSKGLKRWSAEECAKKCTKSTCATSKKRTVKCANQCENDIIEECLTSSEHIKTLTENLKCKTGCNTLTCINPIVGFVCKKKCPKDTVKYCVSVYHKIWIPRRLQR